MPTPMDMVSSAVAVTLQPTIDQITVETSPFCGNLLKTSEGVWRNPEIGRDWKVTRNFALGLGGAVELANINGADIADNGSAIGYNAYKSVQTWPGLGEATAPAFITRELTLKRLIMTMYIPSTLLQIGALSAAKFGNMLELTIRATAKNVAVTRQNLFLGSTRNAIGTFTTGGGGGTINSTGLSITLNAGSSIRRFASGLRVDIFPQTSNVRLNTEPIFVDNVDPFGTSGSPVESGGGLLKLYHLGGVSTVLAATTSYDIVPRNCGRELGTWPAVSGRTPYALDNIIVDTGTVYGIDVSQLTDCKSMVRDLTGRVLTGGQLLKYVAHFIHARGGMGGIDSLWAQPGVWAAYFNALNTEFTIERNGALVNVKDGASREMSYSYGGVSLPFRSDPWLADKTVYGLKTRNNWTLIVPPATPGTKGHPAFDGAIRFMWPLMSGGSNIFGNYRKVGGADAGAFTDFLEAPGEHCFEIAPEQISGLKLINVADLYG